MQENQQVFCQNCQENVDVADGHCPSCMEAICPQCGCTDSEPCLEGCFWMPSGLCSECDPPAVRKLPYQEHEEKHKKNPDKEFHPIG